MNNDAHSLRPLDSLQQVLMDDSIGGNDAVACEEMGEACVVGDTAASFEDDEGTSHVVPLADVALGVGIETTCWDSKDGNVNDAYEYSDISYSAATTSGNCKILSAFCSLNTRWEKSRFL